MRSIMVLVFFLIALPATAQPVYTADDIPKIGLHAVYTSDEDSVITVDVGSTGGPQTWDYSRPVTGRDDTLEVITPAGTPAADSFPDADLVYNRRYTAFQQVGLDEVDTFDVEEWNYVKVTPSEVLNLGAYTSTTRPELPELFNDNDPDRVITPIPHQMGAQWDHSAYSVDTSQQGPFTVIQEVTENSHSMIDAWGEVTVPAGTFEALRTISYDTTVVYVNTGVFDTTLTFEFISYSWRAADIGALAVISSQNGETNLEFTDASGYTVLTSHNLNSIAEKSLVLERTPLTICDGWINLSVTQPGPVELTVFDACGRKVTSLYEGTLPAGEHVVDIPEGITSGVYFVRFSQVDRSVVDKFTVLK